MLTSVCHVNSYNIALCEVWINISLKAGKHREILRGDDSISFGDYI